MSLCHATCWICRVGRNHISECTAYIYLTVYIRPYNAFLVFFAFLVYLRLRFYTLHGKYANIYIYIYIYIYAQLICHIYVYDTEILCTVLANPPYVTTNLVCCATTCLIVPCVLFATLTVVQHLPDRALLSVCCFICCAATA